GVTMARTHDQERLLGTAVPKHLTELQPEKVVRTTNIDGQGALIAVARGHWANWTIDVSFPAALVDRQLRDSLLFWGATMLLVGASVVGLAFLFGRTLTRPLAAATAAAGVGRGGPFPHPRSPEPQNQRRQRCAAARPPRSRRRIGGAARQRGTAAHR